MSRILFVTYGGGHISMVLPVMAALRARDASLDLRLMALTIGAARARSAGETPLGYADFLHLVDADAARALGEGMVDANASGDVAHDESVAYLGINYLDLVDRLGEAAAAEHYAATGRGGFRPLGFMRKLMAEISPDLVVATNSPRSEEAALRAATEAGIPTVAMIDLFDLQPVPFTARDHRPGMTCVLGEPVRRRLIAGGFPEDAVRVTGNPAFDTLFADATAAAGRRFVSALGWEGLHPILYAANPEKDDPSGDPQKLGREITGRLAALVEDRTDAALILRHHPSDWSRYPPPPEHPRIHLSSPFDEPLHPLIHAAQAVVVQGSTVGLEAATLGRPVISADWAPCVQRTGGLSAQGVATGAASPAELAPLVHRALDGGLAAADHPYRSDGRAAEHVADAILDGLATGRTGALGPLSPSRA